MTEPSHDIYRPERSDAKAVRAILILTDDGAEDISFFYPFYRFIEAGFQVDVTTPSGMSFAGLQGLGLQTTISLLDADPARYDMLFLPGGTAPASLQHDAVALDLIRDFVEAGKPVAAVCLGPRLLAAAGVISGCKIAAAPELVDEIRQAGAVYIDQESLGYGPFITARRPADLPHQMTAIMSRLDNLSQLPNGSRRIA